MVVPIVIERLTGSDAVTAVVDDRIYPVHIPQGVQRKPCIAVWIGGNDPSDTNYGKSPVDNMNFMIHIDGSTYAQLDQLCSDIRDVMEAYAGTKVQKIRYVTENDNEYDTDNNLFSRVMTFNVRIQRNAGSS